MRSRNETGTRSYRKLQFCEQSVGMRLVLYTLIPPFAMIAGLDLPVGIGLDAHLLPAFSILRQG